MSGPHSEANRNWNITRLPTGNVAHADAQLAVLMDIRHELQRLNNLLHCVNFLAIPGQLRLIAKNTAKKRKGRNP